MSRSLLQLVVRHAESLVADRESDGDGDLLQRFARTRDESAFAELLRRHGPMVWAVCRQSLPDAADAEDAFQATFLALIRSPDSIRNGNAVPGWLHGTAVRTVGKLKRSAVRRKQREERAAGPEADSTVPEGRWVALIAAVHEEVQRLPDSMRTAFVLCELEGMRQPDAAARLGWKAGTLTSRLTRARQLLIDRLSRRGLAPSLLGTLSLGVAAASAAPPSDLIDSTLALLSAGDAIPPAILELIHTVNPMTRTKLAAATLLLACGFATAFFPATQAQTPTTEPTEKPVEVVAIADEKPQVPVGLQYVPSDAALFAHVDAAKLWGGALGKSIRDADKETFTELVAKCKEVFGASPGDLKAATLFIPDMKAGPKLGVVLVFNAPYDKAKLLAGLEGGVPKDAKPALISPSDTVAVLLVGLDAEKYGKPQAEVRGPLSAAIREAATGKHLISAGSTLANLPDAVLMTMVPEAFQPLLKSEAISAFIGLDKELTLDVRVKGSGEAQTREAARALTALATMASEFVGQGIEAANKEKTLTEIKGVLEAVQTGLKEAKIGATGDTAYATAKISADLPFAMAYLSGLRKVREAASRSVSTNNLKQIAIALHNYHEIHGAMPPAAVCDKTGKPMLSWRVLILPYIEQEALYKKFKLDEPWDSEHNKKLIEGMPRVYANPSSKTAKANETHYRVFVGKGAMFEYLKGPKLTDIKDGTSNTILVATAKDAVPWTKPDELEFDPEKDMTKLLGFFPGDVTITCLADGSVRALNKSIGKKTLHALITASGGEALDKE